MDGLNKILTTISRTYPDFKRASIISTFTPNVGWEEEKMELTPYNLHHLSDRGVTHIQLKIIDGFGTFVYPDYTINELIN